MRTKMMVLAAIGAVMAVGSPALASGEWPIYGSDFANSRSGGIAGPSTAEVGSLQQAWRVDSTKSDFTGTPVVANGVVVAGTNAGTIYAVDASTGKVRWTREGGDPINGTAAIDPAGPGGGVVYVPMAAVGKPHLLALSLRDGTVRWDAPLSAQPGSDVYGSPVIWNGAVFIGTSADQGDVSTARGTVVALDAATGALRWRTFTVPAGFDGGPVWSTPAIDADTGRLFVGTGNAYHPPAADTTDAILALHASTGAILAHHQATPGDAFDSADSPTGPDADFGASPNLFLGADGHKLVGEGQKSGIYWAFDRDTLQPVWQQTVGGPGSLLGGIIGSTAYDGSRLYGPDSTASEIWALNRDGSRAWLSAEPGPINFSPVAVANGVLYTTDFSAFLTARDAATGLVLTKLPLGAPTFGGVSVARGSIYAAVGTQKNPSGSIIAYRLPGRPGDAPSSADRRAETAPASSRLRMSVRPRITRRGRKTRFRFLVTSSTGKRQRGALVRFAGRRTRTSRYGRARLTLRLRRGGRHRATASQAGFRGASVWVRVR